MTSNNRINQLTPFWNALISSALIIAAIVTVFPVVLVVAVSFSSAQSIEMNGYSLIPAEWTLIAYENVFETGRQILDSYIVTIAHTCLGTVLSLFIQSMFAFALAQQKWKARHVFSFITFFTMLFSGGLVPTYIINVRYLHLYDSFWILVLQNLVTAYNVIILRTFVKTTIPDSMLEAARADGAHDFLVYAKIVMPLFKPALATIALFSVVGRWNDWFTGMLYIENPRLIPLQTMLTKIQNDIDFIKQSAAEGVAGSAGMEETLKNMPTESARMAITILSTLPIMFIYPFFQKYFVKGLTLGSIKG